VAPQNRLSSHIDLRFALMLLGLVTLGSCTGERGTPTPSVTSGNDNPLLAEWHTPYGVPPFDLITNEHYLPAFREAMAQHKAEIAAIVDDPECPTSSTR
jgi:peptidyl-dipeptidase Dcp